MRIRQGFSRRITRLWSAVRIAQRDRLKPRTENAAPCNQHFSSEVLEQRVLLSGNTLNTLASYNSTDGAASNTSPITTLNATAIQGSVNNSINSDAGAVIQPDFPPDTPYQLAFIQEPSNTTTGTPISPAIEVQIEDTINEVVSTAN